MRSIVIMLAAGAATGCVFAPSPAGVIDGSVDSASHGPADAAHDAAMSCTSYSTQFDTCMLGSAATNTLALSGTTTYNTDTHTLVQNGVSSMPSHLVVSTSTGAVDVLLVGTLTVGGTFRITGATAFGLAATTRVQIDGTIDLTAGGAGARNDAACQLASGAAGANDTTGGGGGGGGAFHGGGGAGANGDSDNGPSLGGVGGTAVARLTGVLGGCSGGKGGDGRQPQHRWHRRRRRWRVVDRGTRFDHRGCERQDQRGAGGGHKGMQDDGGGGGGGSGGMILLESAVVTIAGVLAANGGGGAEGSDTGDDGTTGGNGTASATRAMAGAGNAPDGGRRWHRRCGLWQRWQPGDAAQEGRRRRRWGWHRIHRDRR